MSATCPHGHISATTDYCDQCGSPMAPTPPAPGPEASSEGDTGSVQTRTAGAATRADTAAPQPAGEPCPACGTLQSGSDRFCEDCGHDFSTATPLRATPTVSSGPGWELVVTADRTHFEQMAAEGVEFPRDYPPRKFALDRDHMRLGRHRPAQGERPEIDLSGLPQDPAISHLQAILVRQEDGSYAVIDPGSTNGITLNDEPDPIAANLAVRLCDGDRLRLGAWTKISVRGPLVIGPPPGPPGGGDEA